ncbi:hypothetical protein H1R20_g2984, partial [Candolleomyces eurysporus]
MIVPTTLFLAALASSAKGYWLMGVEDFITTERIDPIVNPGKVSSHVHSVLGGSNFRMSVTTESLRQSACSSIPIPQDKSAYWFPHLYFQWANGSFTSLDGGAVIDTPGTTTAFPDDFRMISGNAALRTYDPKSYAQQAVTFLCLDFKGKSTRHNELPAKTCPDGIRAQINFPSCWDGKNTDSSDHKSHVAFPSGGPDSGTCNDPRFSKTLPRIFLEVYWGSNAFDNVRGKAMNVNQPFVFAHGDPTGYGYHADFVNGWERGVLQNAVDKCHCNPYGDPTCCVDQGIFSMNHGKTCRITKAIDENTTGTLPKLPGNNPVISQGVATPQSDSVTPALLGPIYAYEGERPTATGKVTAPAVTSKPAATQAKVASVSAATTTPVAAAVTVSPAPVVKPLAPNFPGAAAVSSTVKAPAATPKVNAGRSNVPASEPVLAASQSNTDADATSGQNVATDDSEDDGNDSKSCSSSMRKDKLVKVRRGRHHHRRQSFSHDNAHASSFESL